jgi:hypothetical protein
VTAQEEDVTMSHASDPEPPIACDLDAIDPARRAAQLPLVQRLLGEARREVEELPDGLAFRFGEEHYAALVELVAQERLCCPFFRFVLDVAPQRGPLWLRITGPPEARAILTAAARG